MCRFAAYIGDEPQPLSRLVFEPPHSLQHVAYAPTEQLHGSVNVDGTGVAWWDGSSDYPSGYRIDRPPWADANLLTLSRAIAGTPLLGAVRGATPGIGHGVSHVAPFLTGHLAGVHNGWVGGFPDGVGRSLVAGLTDQGFARLDVLNDSLVLFLMTVDRVEAGLGLADAVVDVVTDVAKAMIAVGRAATLNLAIARQDLVVATRTSVGEETNSLYILESDGVWLASEPLTPDETWQSVAPHSLVTATREGHRITNIDHAGL